MSDKIHLYDLFKEAFLLFDFGDRHFLKQFDLTVPRYYALTHVAAEPGLSPSLLSRYMFCDKSNITRLIKSLEIEGLMERRPHDVDGRIYRLYLTAAGEARLQVATRAHHRYVEQRLTGLDESVTGPMLSVLEELNNDLRDKLDNRPRSLN